MKNLINNEFIVQGQETLVNKNIEILENKLKDIKKIYTQNSINDYEMYFKIDKVKQILYILNMNIHIN